MAKLNFQQHLLQALESHDPSEIIWHANFVFKRHLLLLPSLNSYAVMGVQQYLIKRYINASFIHSFMLLKRFVEEVKHFFRIFFHVFPLFKRTAFIWNINIFKWIKFFKFSCYLQHCSTAKVLFKCKSCEPFCGLHHAPSLLLHICCYLRGNTATDPNHY